METLLYFVIEHWPSLSALIAAIWLRLFPTEKNYDIFSKVLRLLDLIVPNIKKGGGRHVAKLILFFALVSVSVESYGQLNTRTRQLRFATVFQSSDTAENMTNEGRVWYDFITQKYRANLAGQNVDLIGSGGGSGNYWPLSGTGNLTGNIDINFGANNFNIGEGNGIDLSREGGTIWGSSGNLSISYVDNSPLYETTLQFTSGPEVNLTSSLATFGGFKYGADYSANYTSRSLVDKAYADTKLDGTMAANHVPYGVDANTLASEAAFTYTAGSDLLTAGNINVSSGSTGNVIWGTYTPTLTSVLNVSSTQAFTVQYFRLGNMVTIFGTAHATPTAGANTDTSFSMSLPIVSNFTLVGDAGGTAAPVNYNLSAAVIADSTNDRLIFRFLSPGTTVINFFFHVSYIIK